VDSLPKLVGFVLCALQVLAVLFLAYGAYLAMGAADSEKRLVLGNPPAPRRDRRLHNRRHGDRRAPLDENVKTVSAKR